MFSIRLAFTNIIRYKVKSILNLMVCMVLVVLLNLFLGALESNQEQLSHIADSMDIRGQVSNLNGTLQTGLVIREEVVDGILQSKYISKPALSVMLSAWEGEFPKKNVRTNLTIDAAGISDIDALSGLSEKSITLWNNVNLNFLQSNQKYCIVKEEFLKQKNWKLGQHIKLSIYYDYRDKNYQYIQQELKTEDFTIVGSVLSNEGGLLPQIIIPFQWVREIYKEKQIPILANSASFYIKNPMKINQFKKEMHDKLHLLEVNQATDYSFAGNALAVNDETFLLSASRIRDNISLFLSFLPICLLLVAFIGYITSYLLIQNRKGQYATMRSLGMSSRLCFFTLLLESAILDLLGGSLGIIVSMLIAKQKGSFFIILLVIFLGCMIGGTGVALYQLGRINIMKALAQKD